eukprot:CAMPEP_0196586066 /NCGR_PEP_ID=MMETSP1081-20130531/53013_1 /TAXON_ID=36882 /ORGANISM="Pyramimonas amylifera, Strain CCMP720" /LENGTH=204 /DNA_ID=CAMNT_0041907821 /DNA_START=551 /DNA_END=1162 /DNA_ORIENTATION=+
MGEDGYAWDHFFYQKGYGVVFEMGGHEGFIKSISMSFQNSLDWRAFLVEPGKTNAEKIVRNRPHATIINAAVCDQEKQLHFIEFDSVGGIIEFMPVSFMKEFFPQYLDKSGQVKDWEKITQASETVQCKPIYELLDLLLLKHIDMFILDVQGAELSVLSHFDFNATTVSVWVIEVEDPNQEQKVKDLLLQKGYIFHGKIATNVW